jgi:hypothetical protein
LPDGGSHTVLLVEAAGSGLHWAEPYTFTVERALERLKSGKGLRISSYHPTKINLSFAAGYAKSMPSKMPISLWKKILAGELSRDEIDNIDSRIDTNAPDIVDVSLAPRGFEPGTCGLVSGILVWLLSLVMLFHRAIKSRIRPAVEHLPSLGTEPNA